MSDLLSQDEIDALLHGVDDVEEEEIVENTSESKDGSVIMIFLHKIVSSVAVCQPWRW